MKLALFLVISLETCCYSQVSLVDKEKHLVVIKKGQKVFSAREDYMKDKILRFAEDNDTVEVIKVDEVYFQFKKNAEVAWSLTNQVDESSGVFSQPATYEFHFPFSLISSRTIFVYDSASISSSKIFEIKTGEKYEVQGIDGYFFKVSNINGTGFVSERLLIPEETLHPFYILRGEINKSKDVLEAFPFSMTSSSDVYVYDAPSKLAHKIFDIKGGKQYEVTGKQGEFYSINYSKKVGYVHEGSLNGTSYATPSEYSNLRNSSTKSIQTGPRGGQYYINKNGNKTYLKKK